MADATESSLPDNASRQEDNASRQDIASWLGQIHQLDCIAGMQQIAGGTVDLAFADPPFNIGYEYDVYEDRLESEKYVEWSRQWMAEVHRVLKASGAFWLAIGDEYAAELKLAATDLGFHCRSWVIWYYTFGVHCKHKFTRSHAHLFHFVKDPARFTFNHRDPHVRVPSARQLVYGDKRANSLGRMPDDTWILRPQDLVDGFTVDEDVWYFPRVAGTFKERAGFHGCQMPEQLLGRIIRACSNEADVVLDPFSGSATTIAVAKKLGRSWFSFELSEDYAKLGTRRLAGIAVGDPLNGAENPNVSAPSTSQGKPLRGSSPGGSTGTETPAAGFRPGVLDFNRLSEHDQGLIDAFAQVNDGFSLDRVMADPVLGEDLQAACERLGLAGSPAERNRRLFALRKAGKLKSAGIDTTQPTLFDWAHQSQYLFASEIAWRQMSDAYPQRSLDELLCDPRLAGQFDAIAKKFSPGFRPLEYRWAALTLRKKSHSAKRQATERSPQALQITQFESSRPLEEVLSDWSDVPAGPGIYAVCTGAGEYLYASEAVNLRQRLKSHFGKKTALEPWRRRDDALQLGYQAVDRVDDYRLARHGMLVQWYQPAWNQLKPFVN